MPVKRPGAKPYGPSSRSLYLPRKTCIIGWFPWSGKRPSDSALIGPQIHRLTGKLASVVIVNHLRDSTAYLDPVQHPRYIFALQPLLRLNRQTFRGVDIDDRQYSEFSAVRQLVCNKVHRPHLIWPARMKAFSPMLCDAATAFPPVPQR
jgi:hypothetical protein